MGYEGAHHASRSTRRSLATMVSSELSDLCPAALWAANERGGGEGGDGKTRLLYRYQGTRASVRMMCLSPPAWSLLRYQGEVTRFQVPPSLARRPACTPVLPSEGLRSSTVHPVSAVRTRALVAHCRQTRTRLKMQCRLQKRNPPLCIQGPARHSYMTRGLFSALV